MNTLKTLMIFALMVPATAMASLTVFKSPSCGCCQKWIDKLPADYDVQVEHPINIMAIKERLGIPTAAASCHTAVHSSGLFFEGHIPPGLMEQYLSGRRSNGGIGLVVPKMPVGSPGMEHGTHFQPYRVFELLSDGDVVVYEEVLSKAEQDRMM